MGEWRGRTLGDERVEGMNQRPSSEAWADRRGRTLGDRRVEGEDTGRLASGGGGHWGMGEWRGGIREQAQAWADAERMEGADARMGEWRGGIKDHAQVWVDAGGWASGGGRRVRASVGGGRVRASGGVGRWGWASGGEESKTMLKLGECWPMGEWRGRTGEGEWRGRTLGMGEWRGGIKDHAQGWEDINKWASGGGGRWEWARWRGRDARGGRWGIAGDGRVEGANARGSLGMGEWRGRTMGDRWGWASGGGGH
ncbi:hypothetical protein AMTRI_Chr13g82720 [Amborella trichopoda]